MLTLKTRIEQKQPVLLPFPYVTRKNFPCFESRVENRCYFRILFESWSTLF